MSTQLESNRDGARTLWIVIGGMFFIAIEAALLIDALVNGTRQAARDFTSVWIEIGDTVFGLLVIAPFVIALALAYRWNFYRKKAKQTL